MMDMYSGVKNVKIIEDYVLLLEFDNGEQRIFDARPLLSFGKFSELASQEMFKTVRVVFDTIGWANGLDIDPEYLYAHSEPRPVEELVSDG